MLTTAPGVELDVQRGPDWLLIRVDSLDLTPPEPVLLAEEIWDLMGRHLAHRLVLDLSRLPSLDRYVINELLQLYNRVSESGGVMRICGASNRVRRVLRVCQLDDRLHPYDTWEDAVMGFTHPHRPK